MHHANLIIGTSDWGMEQIPLCDREICPDVTLIVLEKFNIADVRTLIYDAGMRPVERPYRAFVIQTTQILAEAQNALLKLFEEPNAHTIFYLIIPRADILLPTLRSRMQILAEEAQSKTHDSFTYFLAMSYAERLDAIATQLKKEDADWVRRIVEGFSVHAHKSRNPILIKDALMLESNIYANGAAKKMLLEHIAFSL